MSIARAERAKPALHPKLVCAWSRMKTLYVLLRFLGLLHHIHIISTRPSVLYIFFIGGKRTFPRRTIVYTVDRRSSP